MNSAAAIIEALNARRPESRMREAARASWGAWLDRLAQRPGRVSGAPAHAVIAELAAREPAPPPPRDVDLGRWQSFATLWRQHWHPASQDERRWRWTAGGVSFVWNLLIAILLLIVTALHVVPPRPAEDEAVQVEYIGQGTPADEGGGPAPAPAATRGDESPARAAQAASAASRPTAAASSPSTAQADEAPASPPQPAPQPLVMTTPVDPEPPTFTVAPTTLPAPSIEPIREPAPAVREITIAEVPRAPSISLPSTAVQVPTSRAPAPDVTVREIPVVPTAPATASLPTTSVSVERSAATAPEVRVREIPSASRASAPTTGTLAPSTGTRASTSPGTSTSASSASASGPASSTTAGVGIGPKSTPTPGSWATPRRGDDWGQSTRDRPGNGIFDGDGRPRLAEGPGSASAAHPPGMLTQEIKDLDRAGTWLKRKPYPYEPTRFDRFWRPNGTLLQDWVEKGVKEVGIPIPGTNKTIKCVISILQLGGGCFDIADPNMQDNPAIARPPPDIPFKPKLQEGNGATWDAEGKAPPPPKLPGLFAPPKSGVPPGSLGAGDDSDGSR